MLNIAQGNETVSSVAGITLVGGLLRRCPSLERLDALRLDHTLRGRFPHSRAVVSSVLLASLGLNDYTDIEEFSCDPVFLDAAGGAVPSEETYRQRLEQLAADGRAFGILDDANVELLQGVDPGRVKVNGKSYVPVDADVSVMAEPCSGRKEGVGWTYKGENGYAPIFAYIGTAGYALAAEMRPGTQHCSKGALAFVERCVGLAGRLGLHPSKLLLRMDSGHDDHEFLAALQGLGVKFIVKRNFRGADQEAVKELVKGSGRAWADDRDWSVCRATLPDGGDSEGRFGVEGIRQAAQLTVRRTDRNGQALLIPEEELECWWMNLDCSAATCIRLYHEHGTSEQCHAELKSDMRMERLPSGRQRTNALVLACALLALNCLRRIGRTGLDWSRHRRSVPRRKRMRERMRARTVIDGFLRVAGHVVRHAGAVTVKLGRTFRNFPMFEWVFHRCCLQ